MDSRTQYVDMTAAIVKNSISVLLPKQHEITTIFALFEPLNMALWVTIMGTVWVTGICVTLCSYFSPYGWRGRYVQRRDKSNHKHREGKAELNYWNGVFFAVGSVLNQVKLLSVHDFAQLIT